MNNEKLVLEMVAIIHRYLPEKEYKVYLFGSWAKGNALPTSDIDIGIMGSQKIKWEIMAKILDEVEEIPTLRKLEIVDLNAVGNRFKQNVLQYAKILLPTL